MNLRRLPYIIVARHGKLGTAGQRPAVENPGKHRGQLERGKAGHVLGRIIKLVFVLVILGFGALTGYAYLVDLSPEQKQITVPVTLDAN